MTQPKLLLLSSYDIDSHEKYNSWVQRADVVVSTAIHEFQSLAVMEVCAMGCLPLVPDRLSYPGFFAKEYRYRDLDQAVDWLNLESSVDH